MSNSTQNTQSDPLTEIAVDWLVKLRGGNLSEEDTHAFADWMSQDPAHSAAFVKAEDFFNKMTLYARHPRPVDVEPIPQENASTLTKIAAPKQVVKPWLIIPLALAASWLVAIGLVLPEQSSLLDNLMSDYHTQTGEIRDIQLADGSHLLLNTNTAVSVGYQSSKRLITLHHGQVRFTVAQDIQRPFEVKTDALVVRALGTVFDVYRKEADSIEVTVQEHAVAARIQNPSVLIKEDPSSQITIEAGQRLTYQGEGALPQPIPVNPALTCSWQQHRLFINNRPLSELVEELNRYRIGRIYLADKELENLPVTGVFPLDNPEEILSSVHKVLGLQETRLNPLWVWLHR
ncbi:FecR family protein [Methylomonas sp. AM2-LC]|uniref:FecR family protein n=1 Tax=Methylomonas sp. AM2-LC TaxID=3153301 RepID=UPI0032643DF5